MTRTLLLAIPCLASLISGCGGPTGRPITPEERPKLALAEVGEIYRLYTREHQRPPAGVADLARLNAVSPLGVHAIEAGEVVVRLGAIMADTEEGTGRGPGDEVLAFLKDVPERGGPVLLIDRSIRVMTAEEFRSAKLAGTSSSSDKTTR